MVDLDRFYMKVALEEAWKYQFLTYPNPAVGAVVVKEGRLLSIAAHKEAGKAHAEVEAIKAAYYRLSGDDEILKLENAAELHRFLQIRAKGLFEDATIYITLEPCMHHGRTPPCTSLIEALDFERVVIATPDPNPKAGGGASYLRQKGIQVETGVCEEEAKDLIEPFLRWSQGSFVFFKLAQRLNGTITGGTISSLASRKFVHKLRSKIDLLVIGGGTVRVDRPILDARLAGGRAPDLLIYSHTKEFDLKIPLFGVSDRKVYIEEHLERIKEHSFVMIEGGEGMLRATSKIVDWYLWFVAPQCANDANYKIDRNLTFLKTQPFDQDILIWSRNG